MGAFPYSRLCRNCKHTWGGMWFSFNIQSIVKGQEDMGICPKCKSTDTCDLKGGNGELEWEENKSHE